MASKTDQVDNVGGQHQEFFRDEKVGARQCLLDSKFISPDKRVTRLSKLHVAVFGGQSCDSSKVDCEEESLERLVALSRVVHDRLDLLLHGRHVDHLYHRIVVLFVDLPVLPDVLRGRVEGM